MLEVIGVEGAVLYRSVRRDVVIEHCDFQIDILLGQDRLHNLKDFSVGCRCGADLNGDGFCVVVVAAGAGGLVGIAAAGRQQAQGQSRCQSNCGELLQFHNKISFHTATARRPVRTPGGCYSFSFILTHIACDDT